MLAKKILSGEFRAVAKGITLVENRKGVQGLMKEIFPHTGNSVVLGITGSPGAGKSTLVDRLVGILRENGEKVGIVAVDPSSPFTGGAILGDRIRMMRHSTDPDVFIRSMATRGHLGGVAKATGEAIAILEAAGKNFILVETVGVGQDEVDVVKLADIVLVVLFPGAGDDIQAFKAGIMEIADVFVLNKADFTESERTERQIKAMLDLGLPADDVPPVVKTVATTGEGIPELMETIRSVIGSKSQAVKAQRKKRLIFWMLKDIINEMIYREVSDVIGEDEFDTLVEMIYNKELDPYTAAENIIIRLKKE